MITNCKNDPEFIVKNYLNDPFGYCRDVLRYEPDQWQQNALQALPSNRKGAVASGHGVGKTRLVGSLIHWFLATRPHPQIVVTANTEIQLATKTWRELVKINEQALNKDWFDHTATRFFLKSAPDTWFAAAIAWSEQRPEAFAGTHENHVLYLFDEASAIPDVIWETSEGAMTTEGSYWWVFGNPTRNTGRFAECWGKFRHRWYTMQVDSRTSKIADQKQIKEWIDDYGEDSDFVRVRVRGIFPRSDDTLFFPTDLIEKCFKYTAIEYQYSPKIFGIDFSHSGICKNVVSIRQGRKVFPFVCWNNDDAMFTASKVAQLYEVEKPDMIFGDASGLGAPIMDRIEQLIPRNKIIKVYGASRHVKASHMYFNKRVEMYGALKDMMAGGMDFPDCKELRADLGMIGLMFTKDNQLQLPKKEDMPFSPDYSDSLSYTFAEPVIRENRNPIYKPYQTRSWRG